jgi:hypothetical protein
MTSISILGGGGQDVHATKTAISSYKAQDMHSTLFVFRLPEIRHRQTQQDLRRSHQLPGDQPHSRMIYNPVDANKHRRADFILSVPNQLKTIFNISFSNMGPESRKS